MPKSNALPKGPRTAVRVRLKAPHPWAGKVDTLNGPTTVTVQGHTRRTYLVALDDGRPVYADRKQFVRLT